MQASTCQCGLVSGEWDMHTYKLYHIQGGHFARCESLQAENDQVAITWAEGQIGAAAAELWRDDQKIAIFRPRGGGSFQ